MGKLLKTARESKEYTTVFVALRVGINPSLLILIENGEKHPTPDFFADLCKVLELDIPQAWSLLKAERVKFYEQRLTREYSNVCGCLRER